MTKCTGMRCPMQYGYKVEECNQTDCPYRTEPITNADRIRAMSDEELANFMAERSVNESTLHRLDKDHGLTSVQIEAIKHNVYCAFMQWLKQPAESDTLPRADIIIYLGGKHYELYLRRQQI